ncbi:MAG: hypothetical protein ACR2PO_14725 [Methyloligellaceae bacterium]
MALSPISATVGLNRSITESRSLLSELQGQLASGRKVETYGDLDIERTQILSFRAELSQIKAYGDTITQTNIRLDVLQQTLERMRGIVSEAKSGALDVGFELQAGGQTMFQQLAAAQFDELVALLNTDVAGRHLYGGRETEANPVVPSTEILDGAGTRAGFKQIASERRQADLGADGRGRLLVPAPVGATTSITEAAPGIPFGFKLADPASTAGTTTGAAIANVADLASGITGFNDGAAAQVLGGVVATPGDIGGAAPQTFSLTIGAGTFNYIIGDANIDTLAGLQAAIDADFGVGTATVVGGNQLQITAPNKTDSITVTDVDAGAAALAGLTPATTPPTAAANDLFRLTVNSVDYDFRIGTDAGEVNTLTDLVNAINGTAVLNGLVTAGGTTDLSITADDTVTSFTIAGDTNAIAGLGLAAGTVNPGGGVTSTLTGTTANVIAGPPANIDFAFSATLPQDGEFIRFTLDLPDGTQTEVTLTARTGTPSAPGQFQIGADEIATAANFQAALDAAIQTEAQTTLSAASLHEASDNFFDFDGTTPPQRVDGPPFDTATALRDGTATDTVFWYQGEISTTSARASAVAKADDAVLVPYGARANEDAFRTVLKQLAAVSVETFSTGDANAKDRYNAITERAGAALAFPNGGQSVDSIITEMTIAQTQLGNATDRHDASNALLQTTVDAAESSDIFEVSVQILALQGRIEASLQISASLGRLSLVNFI